MPFLKSVKSSQFDFTYCTISGTSTDLFKGGISSLIIYENIILTSDRQKVEGYLAWKLWGSGAAILVNDHPYYSIPPY